MTAATNSAGGRSSLLYAMGRLEGLQQEQSRKLDDLPSVILAQINPTLVAIQGRQGDHEKRIRSLERWRWILAGGSGLVLTVATLGQGLLPVIVHWRAP